MANIFRNRSSQINTMRQLKLYALVIIIAVLLTTVKARDTSNIVQGDDVDVNGAKINYGTISIFSYYKISNYLINTFRL